MRKNLLNTIRVIGLILALALSIALVASCAKIGEPQPPAIQIPKPAADLATCQVANSIVLTFTKPALNTDGSEATNLASVQVFRLLETREPNLLAKPLPEDMFIQRAVLIRSIASTGFPEFLRGDSFVITDYPEFPDRSSVYDHAFRYAVLFTNKKNQSAGLSNQTVIAPVAIPHPPSGISAKVTENTIKLTWDMPSENMDGSRPPRVAGYNVYRSANSLDLAQQPVNPIPLTTSEFEDRNFEFDKTYFYALRTVGSIQDPNAMSLSSDALKVETRDAFPPAPPESFNAIREGSDIVLLWMPSPSQDVTGYRIYRRDPKTGSRALVQKDPVAVLSFRDRQLDSETQYEYSIVAVDKHGNESTPVRTEVDVP